MMGAFLLTYLGTLIDEFSTFGEWDEGLLSDRFGFSHRCCSI
jgi:hypothetical protein